MKFLMILVFLAVIFNGCASNGTSNKIPDEIDYEKKIQTGIDFFASGNNPFWSIDIDLEDSARIYIPGGITIKHKVTKPVFDTTKKSITYKFSENTILTIKANNCKNNINGEQTDFSADIFVEGKTYKGCGKYIIASKNPLLSMETLRLNDIWALKSINGNEIDKNNFPDGIPFLELHLNTGKFYGRTDCNEINGDISVGDSYIIFSSISHTKKFCGGTFEKDYISALNIVDSWKLEKLTLSLRHHGEEILSYIKVD